MSTVDIDKELREWLADFATGLQGDPYYSVFPDEIDENDIKELKSTLKAELLAKMPKEDFKASKYHPEYWRGRNETIIEITKIVNEL